MLADIQFFRLTFAARIAGPAHPDAAALFERRLQGNGKTAGRRIASLFGNGDTVRNDHKAAQVKFLPMMKYSRRIIEKDQPEYRAARLRKR
ncbi:hypothetical protein D3C87_1831420 [compost metagenome]